MSATPRTDAIQVDAIGDSDGAMEAMSLCRELERKLAAYEHAFDNILTIIDGKADASVEEGRYVGNDYGSIQNEIDEARR